MLIKKIKFKPFSLLGLMLVLFLSCERDLSDDLEFATAPTTADIFTDAPVGLTDDFFISFDPANGANPEGFGVDENEAYEGTTSIRVDVPAPNDPDGGFIGGIFRDRGNGRDLSGYDALTFWAKGSTTTPIEVGFGTDFLEDKFPVSAIVNLSTGWKKYIIPIPDPSKLIQERGMFLFSAGTENTNSLGYTFWIDELRFEKLGNIGQARPGIMNGVDVQRNTFNGGISQVTGLIQTFNLGNGQNITVNAAPSYYSFTSSDSNVAIVNELGEVQVLSQGQATITAILAGVAAQGSLTLNSLGDFVTAPIPTQDPADVISVFSDSYTSVAGFNPGAFAGSNTGSISAQILDGNTHISYESIDFVGASWENTIDASGMNTMHIDVQLTSAAGSNLVLELIDFGPDNIDNGFGGSDGTAGGTNISDQLIQNQWVSLDLPVDSFTLPTGGGGAGNPNRSNLGFLVLVSNNEASFFVDNIYFY